MSESEILLIDGIEYSLWSPKKEDELEKSVKHHSEKIFGPNIIYFDIKRKITTSLGLGTIPDAYLIDFTNKTFYLIEIELSSHPEYDHINKQIGKFIGALGNYKTRQKIARILKEYIDKDITLKKFVNDKIGNRELYQFFLEDILEEAKEQKYHTVIVIDKITEAIVEACNILNPRPKLLEFRTFVRANVGDLRVHCHLFEPLFPKREEKRKVISLDAPLPDKITIKDRPTLEEHLKNYPKETVVLFSMFSQKVKELSYEIWYKVGRYPGVSFYSPERVFVYLHFRKPGFSLELFTRGEKLEGVKSLAVKSEKGGGEKWGRINARNKAELEKIFPVVKKSFQLIKETIKNNEPTGWYAKLEEKEEVKIEPI